MWTAWDTAWLVPVCELRRDFLENLKLSLLPVVFGLSGHFSFPISKS